MSGVAPNKQASRRRLLFATMIAVLAVAGSMLGPKLGKIAARRDDREALPDSWKLRGEALRERLMGELSGQLNVIRNRYPDDMLLNLNCDVAQERAANDYEDGNSGPFMLKASLVKVDKNALFLWFWTLNVRRETDRLLLCGKMPGGGVLRVAYHFNLRAKDPSLMTVRMLPARKAPIDELRRLGTVKQLTKGEEVCFEIGPDAMIIPDFSPLAAAVKDRNGRISNFVELVEASNP